MNVSSAPLKSLVSSVLACSILFVCAPLASFAQEAADDPGAEAAAEAEAEVDDELFEVDDELFDDDDDLFADDGEDDELGPAFEIPDDVETISILGQKSGSDTQSQSLAITSFNQEQLDQLGVSDVQSLQQNVPSLHIGQTGTQGIITLRGVGIENLTIAGEPGVLFVQDGVPIGNATAALSAFYDVVALNVARGPQGTQGGKHASGGWISITSAPPTPDFSAFGDYEIGSYDQHLFRGVLNAPLFDEKLMFRFTTRFVDSDGYQRAIGTKFTGGFPSANVPFKRSEWWGDQHSMTSRAQFLSQATDRLEIHLIGQYMFAENNGPAIHLLSEPGAFTELGCAVNLNCVPNVGPRRALTTDDPRQTTRDGPGDLNITQIFATAKLRYEITSEFLGDLEATAQYGFNRTDTDLDFDFDGTNANASRIDTLNNSDQNSVEVKLRTVDSRPWDWLIGMIWWQETRFADQFIDFSGTNLGGDSANITELETDSLSGYLELNYWLTDEFRVMVGARYASDHKTLTSQSFALSAGGARNPRNPVNLNETWSAVTPKMLASYQWSDTSTIAFSATNGFKAGGFPLGAGCQLLIDCTPYDAERVWQFELTSKNEFFDERMVLNLTLFWTDYDPYQVCFVAGIEFKCFDDGSATVRGFEVEWTINPVPELTISGNFNLLDARIDNFRIADPTRRTFIPGTTPPERDDLAGFPQDLSGNTLPKSPKYNLTFNVQYDIYLSTLGMPDWGTISPRIQYNYQSRTFYRVWNLDEFSQRPYSKVDLRLTWRSPTSRWEVSGYVNNVTDVDVINSVFLSSDADGTVTGQFQLPRWAGMRIKFTY